MRYSEKKITRQTQAHCTRKESFYDVQCVEIEEKNENGCCIGVMAKHDVHDV